MTASPTLSTTVLGKRRKHSLVLRLSSSPAPTDSEVTPVAGPSTKTPTEVLVVPDPSVKAGKTARYPCTYPECTKSYSKPSRLSEHYRSHTGERPFVCNECGKSYLRETHLQAHSKSHLPESERPYVCTEISDCQKRFWTLQHLHVHENSHRGDKSYACTEVECEEVFAKHHQLRTHICEAHSPPGTKPYICSHPGCTKSFATNQKLRGHLKTHDDKRYTCSHLNCLPSADKDPIYFATWTALQAHMRTDHPPTCTHPSCNGRIFASQSGLRAHQKLHEQQEVEAILHGTATDEVNGEASDAETSRPRKRRRGGELGRDWKCDFIECGKDFKSKKALTTHHNVIHLGQRSHVCPHRHCRSAFGYKHLLERHLAKIHSSKSTQSEVSEDEATTTDTDGVDASDVLPSTSLAHMDIEAITGKSYAARSQRSTAIYCPYPHVDVLLASSALANDSSSSSKACEHVLTRAYDLRRHLKAEHGIDADRGKVDNWVKEQRFTLTS
ncbi:hypothetical protein HYDPIDRAFT_87559 [Hydnomerulius pinastri MD-312]|uniref:C2H2-type domain-containing protein n=1 Tax=Hydnomerulius pinastri MD-312 TaxID=994086 RepID=A0A0C9W6V5_9AGAM|nr:hypothetical protein HYDPIDRAFT_102431 [Hydnomerulius pinastri MD-312]KIJ65852.1 hypothetical protein HYDPIDRAFT_87559 [Hydnomerulius pinastri MD-312]